MLSSFGSDTSRVEIACTISFENKCWIDNYNNPFRSYWIPKLQEEVDIVVIMTSCRYTVDIIHL